MSVVLVVEGDTDLPVARHLAADAGLSVFAEIDCGGKGRLDGELIGYNGAAQGSPWFVLRDLDSDADCAPIILANRLPVPSRWMCFRIAVRELEAWLLADVEGLASFLRVPVNRLPGAPELEPDPTRTLINIARHSRSRAIQKAFVPPRGSSAQVGPLYEASLIEFAANYWNLERAVARSDSLRRTRSALRALAGRWLKYVEGGNPSDR